ncbi:MAG: hypothetical protein MAG453_01830 [Calditrichaeota bacterium]|nr:hypothetical protein [Calditrichota bacterium]
MRLTVFCLIFLMLALQASAGDSERARAETIRADPSYRHGDGYGDTYEEARDDATRQLANSIWTMIRSEQTRTIEETRKTFADTFVAKSEQVSTLQLQGLKYIDLGVEHERHRALAYLSESDLAASNRRQKQRIRALVAKAEGARRRAEIDSAAFNGYWAWLLAHTLLDTLRLDIPTSASGFVKTDLKDYMNALLGDVRFNPEPAVKDRDLYLVDVEVAYHGEPVKELEISYETGAGREWPTVSSGRCRLVFYLSPPVNPEHPVYLRIEYRNEGGMRDHPFIQQLHGMYREREFEFEKEWAKISILIPAGERPDTTAGVPDAGDLDDSLPADTFAAAGPEPVKTPRRLWPMPVAVLADIDSTAVFMNALTAYARYGRLEFDSDGPSALRDAGLDVYVAVADPERVHAVLYYKQGSYLDVRRDVRIDDLEETYGGASNRQIWIGLPPAAR